MNREPKSTGRFKRWWRRVLAASLVLVGALLVYVFSTINNANFHVIVGGEAYRSGQTNTQQLTRAIQNYGIKSILNLRGENLSSEWHQKEIATTEKLNVIHYDRSLNSGDRLTLE